MKLSVRSASANLRNLCCLVCTCVLPYAWSSSMLLSTTPDLIWYIPHIRHGCALLLGGLVGCLKAGSNLPCNVLVRHQKRVHSLCLQGLLHTDNHLLHPVVCPLGIVLSTFLAWP